MCFFRIDVLTKKLHAAFFSFDELLETIDTNSKSSKFLICSGGVSMGDKDFLKDVLKKLGYSIHYGRVNMKPG